MTEGIECKKINLNKTIGSFRHLSLYEEIGYVNNSTYTIYVGTSSGQTFPLYPSKLTTSPTNTIQMFVRMSSGDGRKFRGITEEIPNQGIVVTEVDIPIKSILENEYVYVKEFDLCFCIDENKLESFHKKLDRNIDKRVNAEIAHILSANNTAPIKLFINDPLGMFNTVWMGFGNHVFSADVTCKPELNAYCRLSIGTLSGKYFDYQVDIEEIRKGNICEVPTNDGVVIIGPTEELVRSWIFQQKASQEITYSKTIVNRMIKNATQDASLKIDGLTNELNTAKAKILKLEEELKIYKELHNTKESVEFDREKREWEREKREWERMKMEKEHELKKSSISTDMFLSVLKVLSATIPIAIATYAGLSKAKK